MSTKENIRTNPENISQYVIETVLLQSDRLEQPFELNRITTDIEIYESMTRPFLTGKIAIVENSNLLNNIDFLGGEKLTISIKSLEAETHGSAPIPITKTFYIDEIIFNQKGGDHTEVIAFHLVEDIEFESNLQNINKFFNGNVSRTMKKIANQYLNKNINTSLGSVNSSISVIVPNMHPLESLTWLTKSISSQDGYPYYLFSSFVSDELILADLGSLIESPSVNKDGPYRNWQAATLSDDPNVNSRTMIAYNVEKSDNLYNLINHGFIGANYSYIDTLTNKTNNFDFNIIEDLIKPISKTLLPKEQRNATISPLYKNSIDDKPFQESISVAKTFIGGSNAFKNTTSDFDLSYSENSSLADYKQGTVANALYALLQKSPLTVTVNGTPFLKGDMHYTIGRNVTLHFLTSITDKSTDEEKLDIKKSGDYLIYAAKHSFKREKYDLQITGVKLANMDR